MNGYNVKKAAQVAAFFAIAEGGRIGVLKLVKMIYLADRKFLELYDEPILTDQYVSMEHGPVNSTTLNHINGLFGKVDAWEAFMTDRDNYKVGLSREDISVDDLEELSAAEIEVLEAVANEFLRFDGFAVRDYTHKHCPEWEDPNGSSNPIPLERILKFLGKENPDAILGEILSQRSLDIATA